MNNTINMEPTSLKEHICNKILSIMEKIDTVSMGSLDKCDNDANCYPNLCEKNRSICIKFIKIDKKAFPIDVYLRIFFKESNITDVFNTMLKNITKNLCVFRITILSNEEKDDVDDKNNEIDDMCLKYKESCKGFSIIFVDINYYDKHYRHATVILVENIENFLIWNYYDPHGFKAKEKRYDIIKKIGEKCATISNKNFILNFREESQCPIGLQTLLSKYDFGYCLIFSYFWIWCIINVINSMNTYIPSNQWIKYIEECVSDMIKINPIDVYKKVVSFAYFLYTMYDSELKNDIISNFNQKKLYGYFDSYSIDEDIYENRLSKHQDKPITGSYGEVFFPGNYPVDIITDTKFETIDDNDIGKNAVLILSKFRDVSDDNIFEVSPNESIKRIYYQYPYDRQEFRTILAEFSKEYRNRVINKIKTLENSRYNGQSFKAEILPFRIAEKDVFLYKIYKDLENNYIDKIILTNYLYFNPNGIESLKNVYTKTKSSSDVIKYIKTVFNPSIDIPFDTITEDDIDTKNYQIILKKFREITMKNDDSIIDIYNTTKDLEYKKKMRKFLYEKSKIYTERILKGLKTLENSKYK